MLQEAPLGKNTVYIENYSPNLLFPIPRHQARDKIGIKADRLPFQGVDIWNGFELSWLNLKGKPEVALGEFYFPCISPNIIESKSFKLYLNSFCQSPFNSMESVRDTLAKDLSLVAEETVQVFLYPLTSQKINKIGIFKGICLDTLDIEVDTYDVNPRFLKTGPTYADEEVYSNLLKSNCPATGQPDWGSVVIRYSGLKIDHSGLLKYVISYRKHTGFAEYCVEQTFHDILTYCLPEKLTVYARYTKRGGLDINPFRSNFEKIPENIRQIRQ
jgi:7-cyano-7-deazaguanine reductase